MLSTSQKLETGLAATVMAPQCCLGLPLNVQVPVRSHFSHASYFENSSGTSVDLREFVHIFAPHTLDVKFYPRCKHLQMPSQMAHHCFLLHTPLRCPCFGCCKFTLERFGNARIPAHITVFRGYLPTMRERYRTARSIGCVNGAEIGFMHGHS